MSTYLRLSRLLALLAISLTGCGNWPGYDGAMWLLDASPDQAVLQYAPGWTGMETVPSSLWLGQLPAGDTTRFKNARLQWSLQAGGDFYVTILSTDGGSGSRLVAGQFSNADEWTVLETGVPPDEFTEVKLDGDRVVYRTPDGLTVYSLPERAILKTFPLPDSAIGLLAVGGKYALMIPGENVDTKALLDLNDGTSFDLPQPPDGLRPMYLDAALSDTALITAAYMDPSQGARAAVLILDLPARSWRTLVDYGAGPGGWAFSTLPSVQDADEQLVLVGVTNPWLAQPSHGGRIFRAPSRVAGASRGFSGPNSV